MSRVWFFWLLVAIVAGLTAPLIMAGVPAYMGLLQLPMHVGAFLVLLILVSMNLHIYLFRRLLRHYSVGLGQLNGFVALSAVAFAANVTPGGVGAPLLTLGVLRRFAVPAAVTASSMVLAAFLDTIVLLFMILWALSEVISGGGLLPPGVGLYLPASLLLIFLLTVLFALHHLAALARIFMHFLKLLGFPASVRFRAGRMATLFRTSLEDMMRWPWYELFFFTLICTVQRLMRYSIVFITVGALGGDISWLQGFLVQLIAWGAARLLVLPGGIGSAELVGIALLSQWVPADIAATSILVWRFMTFYLYLLLGAPCALWLAKGRSLSQFFSADVERY